MQTFTLCDYKTIDVDARTYIYLAPHNAIFEIDGQTEAMLKSAVEAYNGTPVSRRTLLDGLPGSTADKQETVEQWERIGLLRPLPGPLPAGL